MTRSPACKVVTIFEGTTSSPLPALGRDEVALAAMTHAHFPVQDLVFPHDAEPSALGACTPGIAAQRDAMDADGGVELECFGRQIHAIGSVGLDHIDAILVRARAGAARN